MLKRQRGEERLKNKDNITGEQLAAVLREQTERERRIKPIEKRIDKLEEYDKEIAGLKKNIGSLNRVVDALVQNWRVQVELNKARGKVTEAIFKFARLVQARIESKASREEMRTVISEISKNMQSVREGTIKTIEGFKLREQG